MAPPEIYSDSSKTSTAFNDISFNDGATLMTTVYTDIKSTFSLAGTDAHLMTIQYDSAGLSANIVADAVADHKTKESYSFTVVATSVSNNEVQTQQIIVAVTATTVPVFQLVAYSGTNSLVTNQTVVNALTIADGAKDNVFKFATDEVVSGSTFALTGSAADNTKVTLASDGQLKLNNYASAQDGTLSIEVTATAVYGGLTKVLTMTITFTDGSPTFLQSLNGAKQDLVGDYVFTVADASNVLSNSGNMFSTDSALYTLTGADSANFTVSPTTGGADSKTAVLALTDNALKQEKSSYSLNIVATDASANSTTNAIVVNVGADTTDPNLTFGAHADATLTSTATFTINDNNGKGVGTVSADENCTFSIVAGSNAGLFQLSNTSEVAANIAVNFSLINAAAINLDATYTFTIRATDAGANAKQTDQLITVKVIDDTKPVLTITSTAVANGPNTFTNLQSVPFVIVSSEELSGVMVVSDISLNHGTGGVAPTISDFVGAKNGATFNIQPQGDNNLVTISVLAGTVGDVIVGTNSQNMNALTEFRFQRDVSTPSIDISGSAILNPSRGFIYSDAGATSTEDGLVIVTVINVDPKTLGTYYVTYTIEDSAGNRRSKSRTVNIIATNERSKPVISLANSSTLTVVYKIGDDDFGSADDDAIINVITNSLSVNIAIVRDYESVDRSLVGPYNIKYKGNDNVYGDLVELLRTINIQDNIDFSLESLNADSTLTQLTLTDTQAVADTDAFSNMPGVAIDMPISDWNDIFYMSPEADGLTELSELAHIDVFGTEEINYKTNSANLHLITGLISAKVNQNTSDRSAGGNVNESLSNQEIKQVVTSNWAYDIFGREKMSDLFANTSAVQAEINGKLNETGAGTLDALWKAHIDTANDMSNNNITAANLSRQLMLQLHAAISSTTSKTRLTNSGMFAPANKRSDASVFNNYYPFKFEIGDKLSFSMTFKSPTHTVANYYPFGATPKPVSIKVQISMIA
jgi:hypothetical protein